MDTLDIRLIRNTNSAQDDHITFRRRLVGGFLLRYKDGQVNAIWVNDKTPEQVCDYVEDLLNFVVLDAEPFVHIQFTIPGYPIIYLTHKNITPRIVDSILSNVYEYVYHPPRPF